MVHKETSTKAKQQSQNVSATMDASTISGASKTGPIFEGIVDLKRKLAEIDTERNSYSAKQQKLEDDVSTLTQSMQWLLTSLTSAKIRMASVHK
jgi:phage-related protein